MLKWLIGVAEEVTVELEAVDGAMDPKSLIGRQHVLLASLRESEVSMGKGERVPGEVPGKVLDHGVRLAESVQSEWIDSTAQVAFRGFWEENPFYPGRGELKLKDGVDVAGQEVADSLRGEGFRVLGQAGGQECCMGVGQDGWRDLVEEDSAHDPGAVLAE